MPKLPKKLQRNFSLYQNTDNNRQFRENRDFGLEVEKYRTEFRRDYSRLLHTPAFRRLCNKTQLYPGIESDFFRNRLTHSLEVAQIAKSLALRINNTCFFPDKTPIDLNLDLIEFAGLSHDIGHPPFGHQGEKALNECMVNHGGFEGNAQTLRILTKQEKKFLVDPKNHQYGITDKGEDIRLGLNLTVRTIASILKYDKIIPSKGTASPAATEIKLEKGYYESEADLILQVKRDVLRSVEIPPDFKTVECQIMDIADDIAYSTYDLEDGLKAGFYHPLDIVFSKDQLLQRISERVSQRFKKKIIKQEIQDILIDLFKNPVFTPPDLINIPINNDNFFDYHTMFMGQAYKNSKEQSKNGYSRTALTSHFIGIFIRGIRFELNEENPALSKAKLAYRTRLKVEVLKTFNYESMILSPRLKIAEFRGQEIVSKIFKTLSNHDGNGFHLMPKDYQNLYVLSTEHDRYRIVCDYISGMTDRYCIEFYGRLTSENPETIFKPF